MVNEIQPSGSTNYSQDVNGVERNFGVSSSQANQQVDKPDDQRFASASAEVNLSSGARTLHNALQTAKQIPDIREDVVQNIRSQIESNNYEIDFESLADRLLPLLQ